MTSNRDQHARYSRKDFTDPTIPYDRVLVVGEEKTKFYVFAGHLSFCSEFFNTLFNGDFKEKDETEVELKELDADDFQAFLNVLIPGNHTSLTVENYLPIMVCANRFLASDALAMCKKFIFENIESMDKIDLLKIAFEYNLEELKERLAVDLTTPGTPFTEQCLKNCDARNYSNYCNQCSSFFNTKNKQCSRKHSAEYYGKYCMNCASYFKSKSFVFLNQSSFLVKNKEKLADLSDEINVFILKALLNKADK